MSQDAPVTIREAITLYLDGHKSKADEALAQQELHRFAQWFGQSRPLSNLTPFEIEAYGQHMEGTGAKAKVVERVKAVKSFLSYTSRQGLVRQNLAQHLRSPRTKAQKRRDAVGDKPAVLRLTPEGHMQLQQELERRKSERAALAIDIRQAAADKDVRENAPLEAAREQLGHTVSRIREIEDTLKNAVVMDTSHEGEWKTIALGARVLLKDVGTGRETTYTVVSALEANPLEGRISDVSPVGKALMRRTAGQDVEVQTPRGSLRYRIISVSS